MFYHKNERFLLFVSLAVTKGAFENSKFLTIEISKLQKNLVSIHPVYWYCYLELVLLFMIDTINTTDWYYQKCDFGKQKIRYVMYK